MSDWQVGDLAVCVDATPHPLWPRARRLSLGHVYTVTAVIDEADSAGEIGLQVDGFAYSEFEANGIWWNPGFAAYRFRKIRPDEHEACEEEFQTLLRRSRNRVPA